MRRRGMVWIVAALAALGLALSGCGDSNLFDGSGDEDSTQARKEAGIEALNDGDWVRAQEIFGALDPSTSTRSSRAIWRCLCGRSRVRRPRARAGDLRRPRIRAWTKRLDLRQHHDHLRHRRRRHHHGPGPGGQAWPDPERPWVPSRERSRSRGRAAAAAAAPTRGPTPGFREACTPRCTQVLGHRCPAEGQQTQRTRRSDLCMTLRELPPP